MRRVGFVGPERGPSSDGLLAFRPAAAPTIAPRRSRDKALREHAAEGEAIEVVGRVAYLPTPFGLGTSKLGEKFDKGIGVPNAARNWNTVLKLLELAKEAAG